MENLSREDAFNVWEKFFIAAIGRLDQSTGPLTNLTAGGEGVVEMGPEARSQDFRVSPAKD